MDEEISIIVIDNGSFFMKTGFGGDEYPRAVFPSITGTPRTNVTTKEPLKDIYIGDDALSKRRLLNIHRPIQQGIVHDWDHMEKIWQHTFYNEVRVLPEEALVILSEPPLNPKPNRERTTQIMFETFLTPALCLANQASLALRASGVYTGVVLDSGYEVTRAIPVYAGHVLDHAVMQLNFGGQDLTDYLIKIMDGCGYSFESLADREVAQDIKEKLCYVALDLDQELEISAESSVLEKSYDLPNSNPIPIHRQRFQCPEPLFQPSLIGHEAPGVHELLQHAISKCDTAIQTELYSNVVIAGGSTLFPGFADRLKKELTRLAPPETAVHVIPPNERRWSTWKGGSDLANWPHFPDMCVTTEDYNEIGSGIVHRKCF